jgi:[protein-PII] uridylyltransferase
VAADDGSHVWVAGQDRVGLLRDVAGTLAWAGLTVRGLRAVSDGARGMRSQWDVTTPALETASLVLRLRRVLDGSVSLDARIPPAASAALPARIDVVDTPSAGATVLELRAADRQGLLWRTFRTLAQAGMDVRSAHVDTLGSQAVDVLYLVDCNGSALAPEVTERLVRSLTASLA